jgi:hypothetical protein
VRTETILKSYSTLVLPTFLYGSEIGLWQPHRDEELSQQKWNCWGLCQTTPLMTIRQTIPYAANYRLNAY